MYYLSSVYASGSGCFIFVLKHGAPSSQSYKLKAEANATAASADANMCGLSDPNTRIPSSMLILKS